MSIFKEIEKEEFSKINPNPKLISDHKILLTALLITTVAIFKLAIFFENPPKNIEASDLVIQNILNGINEQRSLRNLPTLNTDSRLALAAQEKSDDMQKRHYFSHTDPEGNFIWNKIIAAGYTPYQTLGENLAIEFYNTESLIQAWMNSPTHRDNVLNESFKDQGIGINLGDEKLGQYHSAITNTFGSLFSSKAPTPSPVPKTTQKKPTGKQTQIPVTKKNPAPSPTPISKTPEVELTPSMALQPAGTAPSLNVRGQENLSAQSSINPLNESDITPKNNSLAENAVIGNNENSYSKNKKLSVVLALLLVLLLFADLKLLRKEKFPGLDKKINNLSLLFLAILLTALLYWF